MKEGAIIATVRLGDRSEEELRLALADWDVAYEIVSRAPTVREIAQTLAGFRDVAVETIVGDSRLRRASEGRAQIAWFAHQYAGRSLKAIGAVLGDRDDATIGTRVRRGQELRTIDAAFRAEGDRLIEHFGYEASAPAPAPPPAPSAPARPTLPDQPSARRRSLIAKVHIAKAQLKLIDDDYRAILLRIGGAVSAAEMTDDQLVKVVEEFQRLGFSAKARAPGRTLPADHPVATKARAMWISLHQLGVVRYGCETSLEGFSSRQLKATRLQWANQSIGYKLIEALKAMAERAGWDQSVEGIAPGDRIIVLKRRLIHAQYAKMIAAGLIPERWSVERAVFELGGIEERCWLTADLQTLERIAAAFGAKIHSLGFAVGE